MVTTVDCPICSRKVEWTAANRFRPFCSERCKKIDLGAWAAGDYTIPEQTEPSNDLPDAEEDFATPRTRQPQ